MSRGLTTTQNNLLSGNPFIVERLLEIQTPSVSYYYTTGPVDVVANTGTSGGNQTFYRANGIEIIGDTSELYQLNINELTIQIGDIAGIIYDELIRASTDYDYQRTNVQLYMMFRNTTTFAPYYTDTINIFKGGVTKLDIIRNEADAIINLRVSSKFASFDKQNGRTSSDFSQGLTPTGISWGRV